MSHRSSVIRHGLLSDTVRLDIVLEGRASNKVVSRIESSRFRLERIG